MSDNDGELPTPHLRFSMTDPPIHMRDFDVKFIVEARKDDMAQCRLARIRENHIYIKEHPEIPVIIQMMLSAVLEMKPFTHFELFLAAYFTQPKEFLIAEINKRLKDKKKQNVTDATKKVTQFNDAEDSMKTLSAFSKSTETDYSSTNGSYDKPI